MFPARGKKKLNLGIKKIYILIYYSDQHLQSNIYRVSPNKRYQTFSGMSKTKIGRMI